MKLYIWCSATSNFEHPRYLFFVRNLKSGVRSTPNSLFVKSILVPYDFQQHIGVFVKSICTGALDNLARPTVAT